MRRPDGTCDVEAWLEFLGRRDAHVVAPIIGLDGQPAARAAISADSRGLASRQLLALVSITAAIPSGGSR
jgi:hypothetical protein